MTEQPYTEGQDDKLARCPLLNPNDPRVQLAPGLRIQLLRGRNVTLVYEKPGERCFRLWPGRSFEIINEATGETFLLPAHTERRLYLLMHTNHASKEINLKTSKEVANGPDDRVELAPGIWYEVSPPGIRLQPIFSHWIINENTQEEHYLHGHIKSELDELFLAGHTWAEGGAVGHVVYEYSMPMPVNKPGKAGAGLALRYDGTGYQAYREPGGASTEPPEPDRPG